MNKGKESFRLCCLERVCNFTKANIYDRILDMVPGAIDKLVELKDNFIAKREEKKSNAVSNPSDFSAE